MRRRQCPIALVMLVISCGGSDDTGAAAGDSTLAPLTDATVPVDSAPSHAPLPPGSIPDRPPTITDTVLVEGSPQIEQVKIVRAPAGFPVPFTTYAPNDMVVSFNSDSEPAWVRFEAAFGGVHNRDAFMQVRVYRAGTTRLMVDDAVRMFISGRAPATDETTSMDAPAWGEAAMRISYAGARRERFAGSIVIARHGPLFFDVIRHYPAEYGDGMPPRLIGILERWRWEETGRMLTGS